jgi:hypothetical protein
MSVHVLRGKALAKAPHARLAPKSVRIIAQTGLGMCLAWGVLTKSLPFVLAETHPEIALRLDPRNPVALIALAERQRAKLLQLRQSQDEAVATLEVTDSASNAGPASSQASPGQEPAHPEIDQYRKEIADLARRAIANDPLNAHGFRLLAELADTPEQTRLLMNEAVKRSRRESMAVFWLLTDSFARKDFGDVVEKAQVLLRTGSNLAAEAMRYLCELAAIPDARPALVAALAQRPSWRSGFFNTLPNSVELAGTPFELMIALKDAGSEIGAQELAPYLNVLVRENLAPYARDVWLQVHPESAQSNALLNNAAFAEEPSGLPFDWTVKRGANAMMEFAPLGDQEPGRSVRFSFGGGRAQFPELSQMIVLAPGRYRFSGEMEGMIRARRGLRWEVRCWKGNVLVQSEMLYGLPIKRQPVDLDIDVPDSDDCRSQQLRLFHDARSASEQLISGQASFRSLTLTAVAQ